MPPNSTPPDPPPRSLSTGAINSGGGPVAVGGDVYDQRTTVLQAAPVTPTATRSLPAPTGDFVGRAAEIDALVAELRGGGAGAAISGLRGMGGIGKTQLALMVAARLAESYPDGQVFLSLYGATATPAPSEATLTAVIRAFAPDAARLPDTLADLAALYRSLLAGKRVLILADDAADAAQIKPLAPPPGCALLVTSRRDVRLPGLHAHKLGTLPRPEAVALLRSICDRLTAEQADPLARLCGDLPLALRASASLLATEPNRAVNRYLEALSNERTRLAALRDPDDSDLDMEASLGLSWAALPPDEQTALAQLSVFPAPFDFAAALAVVELHSGDTEDAETIKDGVAGELEAVLGDLLRRSLLDYDEAPARYRLHDLVRVFAAARLADPGAARWRHARHYAAVTEHASDLYDRGGDALMAGLALFDGERAHIDGAWTWVREQMATAPAQVDPLLLAFAYATGWIGLLRYDARRERIPQMEAAVAAARRSGDQGAEGWFLGNLGSAYTDVGEPHRAIEYHEQHLARARALGDRWGEAAALGNLASAYYSLGEPRRTIEYHEQALAIDRAIGARGYEAGSLGNLGLAYAALGKPRRAIKYHKQHLALARTLGDRWREGQALGSLGNAYADLGAPVRAIAYYEQALDIDRALGNRPNEVVWSWNLGLLLEQQGDLARAVELMQVRVAYLQGIGHPDAEECAAYVAQVRARLAEGGGPADHE